MKIAMVLDSMYTWDAAQLYDDPNGISGTDIQCFGCAFALARRGHDVTVYGSFLREFRHESGALFRRFSRYLRESCDVVIAYHNSTMLKQFNAGLRLANHQTYLLNALWGGPESADVFFSASELNAQINQERYGGKWVAIDNACDEGERPKWNPVPGRLTWNTDPYRGLHNLFRLLPAIREEVPEAHLHVIGWVPERLDPTKVGDVYGARARDMHRWLELLGDCVTLHDRMSRNATLKALSESNCFAYTCDPTCPCEVWPLSVTDCLATGCPVVLKPADGIERIFKGGAWLVDNDDAFALEVIRVLREEGRAQDLSKQGRKWAKGRTFDKQAIQMEALIAKAQKEKAA